jgi:hypothetical protein
MEPTNQGEVPQEVAKLSQVIQIDERRVYFRLPRGGDDPNNWTDDSTNVRKIWTLLFYYESVIHFWEHMDSSCPNCDFLLAIVSFPTVIQMRSSGDREDIRQAERIERLFPW